MTLVSAPSETLRALMQQQIAEHDNRTHALMCDWCHQKWPCDDHRRATDAIAILDFTAPRDEGGYIVLTSERTHCLVPDPEVLPPPPAKTPQEETA